MAPDQARRKNAARASGRRASPEREGDAQPVNRKQVHGSGLEEGIADVAAKRCAPAEGHGPEQAQRSEFVFHRQTKRERVSGPIQKPIGEGRMRQDGRAQLPVVGGLDLEFRNKSRAFANNRDNQKSPSASGGGGGAMTPEISTLCPRKNWSRAVPRELETMILPTAGVARFR